MLPFLKSKHVAGLIIEKRKPDESSQPANPSEDNNEAALHAAADDLINAIHNKDVKAASSALKAAFEILDSQEEVSEDLDKDEE